MTRFVNKSIYGFFFLTLIFDTSSPKEEQISSNILIENFESFEFLTRSQVLRASYTIGCACWIEMSVITSFLRVCLCRASFSASFWSSSSLCDSESVPTSTLCFEARREKKLATCRLVRNSLLLKRRSPFLSLAVLIPLDTIAESTNGHCKVAH